jgi:hypothetical protein
MPLSEPLYHVGIVVPDLRAAQEHLTALLGLSWGRPSVVMATAVRDGAGRDFEVDITCCYSREAPHIELILEQPGTTWVCNEHSNLHHIGVWAGAMAGDSAAMVGEGCPLVIGGRDGDVVPHLWAYHRDPLGFNIELVDASTRALSEAYMFGPSDLSDPTEG